jgi:drug/metabolite transporter (DMT)-like permease
MSHISRACRASCVKVGGRGKILVGGAVGRRGRWARRTAAPPLIAQFSARVSSPRPFVLAVLGIAALCVLDAAVKELTRSYPVAYAVLGRYVFGTGFALAVWYWQGRPRLTREMVPAHLLRGTLITVTAFLFFFALTRLGMAEAITLSFIAPLLIPPLAHLFLGEKMRGPVVLAAFVGFAGVLLTVQGAPSFDGERALALAAILAAALTAGEVVFSASAWKCTRRWRRSLTARATASSEVAT